MKKAVFLQERDPARRTPHNDLPHRFSADTIIFAFTQYYKSLLIYRKFVYK